VKECIYLSNLTEVPGIGPATAAKLEAKKINSADQLSIMDPEELKVILESSLVEAKKLIKGAKDLTSNAVQIVSGEDLDKERKATIQKISTGSSDIDRIMDGGVPTDALTAFTGAFSTGKTQLCMELVVNMKKQFNRKSIWLETEPQTCILDRIQEIAKAQGTTVDLKNDLMVVSAKFIQTPTHLFKAYELVEEKIKSGMDVGLIVIDSFNGPFRSTFTGREMLPSRSAETGRHVGYLQKLASLYNIAIVLTLQVMGVPDSIISNSPIMITDGRNKMDIIPIEDLWNSTSSEMMSYEDREIKKIEDKKILSHENTWSDMVYIQRHKYNGKMRRITATTGMVEVSPNHSIYSGRNLVNSLDLKEGDLINPQYHIRTTGYNKGLFIGGADLAWIYGFFSANGSIYTLKRHDRPNTQRLVYVVSFSSYDKKILLKAQSIIRRNFGLTSHLGGNKLIIRNKDLFDLFLDKFYTKSGRTKDQRKVPYEILNSNRNIKSSFLKGFNRDKEITNFNTTSSTLATGLVYLLQTTSKKSFSVRRTKNNKRTIEISINKGHYNDKEPGRINLIEDTDYRGYLYDIETKSHKFKTGIGMITVHNSGAQLGSLKRYGIRDAPVAPHVLKHGVNFMVCLDQLSANDKTWTAVVADGPVPRADCIFCIDESGIRNFAKSRGVR